LLNRGAGGFGEVACWSELESLAVDLQSDEAGVDFDDGSGQATDLERVAGAQLERGPLSADVHPCRPIAATLHQRRPHRLRRVIEAGGFRSRWWRRVDDSDFKTLFGGLNRITIVTDADDQLMGALRLGAPANRTAARVQFQTLRRLADE